MEFLFILIVVSLIAFVVYNNVKRKNKREEKGSRKASPTHHPMVEIPSSAYSNPVARPSSSCSTRVNSNSYRPSTPRKEVYSEEVEVIPVPVFVDTTPYYPVYTDNLITVEPERIYSEPSSPAPVSEPVFESSSRDFGGGSSGGGGASASWEPAPTPEPTPAPVSTYSAPEPTPTPTYSAPEPTYSSSSNDSYSSPSSDYSSSSSD